jgi:hypothetical protein
MIKIKGDVIFKIKTLLLFYNSIISSIDFFIHEI